MNARAMEEKARAIRRTVLEMIVSAGKGHIGGAYSSTEILVALHYGGFLRRERGPGAGRDRFLLSKGHSCASLYAVLADLGVIPRDAIENFQRPGTLLRGHPDRHIPGIESDAGSLGHGLGIASGLALAARLDGRDDRTFVLLGDGECNEGQVWEAALFAAQHRLDNLCAVVDHNGFCSTDRLANALDVAPLREKWEAFGWRAVEVDGHSPVALCAAFEAFAAGGLDRPTAVVARTVKGKGVSFMENVAKWHHGVPKGDEVERARKELGREDL